MKLTSILFRENFTKKAAVLAALFSFSQSLNATHKYMQLEPLVGSEWADQHPGQLPYSKCSLVKADYHLDRIPLTSHGTWKTPEVKMTRVGIVIGSTIDMPEYYFSCVSQKHKLAFMLPIKLESIVHFPEVAVVGADTHNHLHFNKSSLSQVKVSSLLKRFVGAGLNASVVVGGGGYLYGNIDGVTMTVGEGELSIYAHAAAGLSTAKLKRVRNEKLPRNNMVRNAAYLVTNETAPRSLQDPIVVRVDDGYAVKTAEIVIYRDVLRTAKVVNANGEEEELKSLMKVPVVIPAGTLARWNGVGFDIEYSLKHDYGTRYITETFSSIRAMDNSVINEVINDRVFIGKKAGLVILHRANGSIIRNTAVDLNQIKGMTMVWDEA